MIVWDAGPSARITHTLTDHKRPVRLVAFSQTGPTWPPLVPTGRSSFGSTLTGRESYPPLDGHAGGVGGVAFSPNGTFLASVGRDPNRDRDRSLNLWDVLYRAGRDNHHRNRRHLQRRGMEPRRGPTGLDL